MLSHSQLPACRVCGKAAQGFHYGVNSCEACKAFFHRSLTRSKPFKCTKSRSTSSTVRHHVCAHCRLLECVSAGMSTKGIKIGRYSYAKKTQDFIDFQQQTTEQTASTTTHQVPLIDSFQATSTTTLQVPPMLGSDEDKDLEDFIKIIVQAQHNQVPDITCHLQQITGLQEQFHLEYQLSTEQPAASAAAAAADDDDDNNLKLLHNVLQTVADNSDSSVNNDSFKMTTTSTVDCNPATTDIKLCYNIPSFLPFSLVNSSSTDGIHSPVLKNCVTYLPQVSGYMLQTQHSSRTQLAENSQDATEAVKIGEFMDTGVTGVQSMAVVANWKDQPVEECMEAAESGVDESLVTVVDVGNRKDQLNILNNWMIVLDKGIRGIVHFAQEIPGFRQLSVNDQITLIKRSICEVWVVTRHQAFNFVYGCFTAHDGFTFDLVKAVGAKLSEIMFTVARRLQQLQLTDEETFLLKAYVIFAENCGLEEPGKVEVIRSHIQSALLYLLKRNHSNDRLMFARLTSALTELRNVADGYERYSNRLKIMSASGAVTVPSLFWEVMSQ